MDAHEELVDAIKEIVATGCGCDRHCDGMTGPDVYCGCEHDARAAISAVAEALSKPTEGAVRAAVRAQSQFRMNLRSTSPLEWSVTDMRGDEPVVVGVYPNKDYAETALLNFGQGAAIDAALSASPLYPKGE